MIKKNYFPTPSLEPYTFLHLFETPNGEYRISAGQSRDFTPIETRIVPKRNHEVLLSLVHELSGIPYTPPTKKEPIVETPVAPEEKVVETPVAVATVENEPMSPLEEQLNSMPASEIIAKVLQDTGVKITLSPKSKRSIIKKALALYNK